MNRRQFLAAVGALALTLSGFPAFAQLPQPEKLDLTILHTNDLHGHMLPFAYTEPERSKEEQPSVGGAARRATLINSLKKRIKNPVLVLDGGDTATRGPLTNAYEGIADVEAMNAVGYDLGVIGNNEFKLKDGYERFDAAGAQAALTAVLRRAHFPRICANAFDEKGCFLPGVQPFIVREINGVRVGFLGLTAPRSADYPQTVGWKITDPVAAAKEWIPKARKECDILIALTHIGVDDDTKLAAQTTGLDAIVGGDSHTFLYKAVEVDNADHTRRVPIVQTGEFGVNLGRFDLHFVREGVQWGLARYEYALLPIGPGIKDDRRVADAIARYARPWQNVVFTLPAEKIGRTIEERNVRTTEVIAEALRRGTGADLALNTPASLYEVFRAPKVTRYDLWSVMPFKDRAVTAKLTGAEIQALLKKVPATVAAGDIARLDPARTYTVAFVGFPATSTYGLTADRLTEGKDVRELIMGALAP